MRGRGWMAAGLAVAVAVVPAWSGVAEEAVSVMDIEAVYADEPVQVDGRLDDAVWAEAPVYELSLAADRAANGSVLQEGGKVRFAWNESYFYMAVDFVDSDVVAEGTEDGEHHYKLGDLAELFLWPEAHPWYWELYVTPHALQTSFFFPSPGRLGLPSTFRNHVQLTVAARVDGTLNDWSDRDRGWTAEMAVPVAALTKHGDAWGPEAAWRVMVGRYNYSVHLPGVELSCLPALSRTSFHLRNEYGRLRLLPRREKPAADEAAAEGPVTP